MVDENLIPNNINDINANLLELNIELNNYKELFNDEIIKEKKFAVKKNKKDH